MSKVHPSEEEFMSTFGSLGSKSTSAAQVVGHPHLISKLSGTLSLRLKVQAQRHSLPPANLVPRMVIQSLNPSRISSHVSLVWNQTGRARKRHQQMRLG